MGTSTITTASSRLRLVRMSWSWSAAPQKQQACFIARLPVELLQRIIRENYYLPQVCHYSVDAFRRRRGWLASVALVCRHWHAAVVCPVLYAEVILQTFTSASLFLAAIMRAPSLARYVRWLACSSIEDDRPQRRRTFPFLPVLVRRPLGHPESKASIDELLSAIVQRCPNVRKYVFDPDHLGVMRDIRDQWTDNIDFLCVTYIRRGWIPPWAPNLRSLNLWWTRWSGPYTFEPGFPSAYPHLRFLSFSYLTTSRTSMLALLSSVRSTLRSLGCDCVSVAESIGSVSAWVPAEEWLTPLFGSDSFRELRLTHWRPAVSGVHSYRLAPLTDLTDLALNAYYARDPLPWDFYPPQLERIRFLTQGDRVIIPLTYARHAWRAVMLDRCHLPKLKSVEMHVMATREAHTYEWTLWAFLLHNAARRRGLEFVLDIDIGYYWPTSYSSSSPPSNIIRTRDRIVEAFRTTARLFH